MMGARKSFACIMNFALTFHRLLGVSAGSVKNTCGLGAGRSSPWGGNNPLGHADVSPRLEGCVFSQGEIPFV